MCGWDVGQSGRAFDDQFVIDEEPRPFLGQTSDFSRFVRADLPCPARSTRCFDFSGKLSVGPSHGMVFTRRSEEDGSRQVSKMDGLKRFFPNGAVPCFALQLSDKGGSAGGELSQGGRRR